MTDRILVVDFGSQVTQLIARRVRECGVYCEIHPFNKVTIDSIKAFDPNAVILSGDPHRRQTDPPVPLMDYLIWDYLFWVFVTVSKHSACNWGVWYKVATTKNSDAVVTVHR